MLTELCSHRLRRTDRGKTFHSHLSNFTFQKELNTFAEINNSTMNKKFLLFTIILGFAFTLHAKKDNYIYKTYKDFTDTTGDAFTDLNMIHTLATVTITFTTSDGKVKYNGKQIWGYKYKGKIFRGDKRTGQFAMLVSEGKICYYENGWAHTLMLKNNSKSADFSVGYYNYVSKSIKTDLTPLPGGAGISDAKKLTKDFRAKYPQYESFFESIGKNWAIENVRKKVADYNKKEGESKEDAGDD
jgi:hypothetical protein